MTKLIYLVNGIEYPTFVQAQMVAEKLGTKPVARYTKVEENSYIDQSKVIERFEKNVERFLARQKEVIKG